MNKKCSMKSKPLQLGKPTPSRSVALTAIRRVSSTLAHAGRAGLRTNPRGDDHTLGGNVGKSGGVWEVTSQRHRPAMRGAAPPWPAAPPTVNSLKSVTTTPPVLDEQSKAPAGQQPHSATTQLRPPKAQPLSHAIERKRTAAAICSLLGSAPPPAPRTHKRSRTQCIPDALGSSSRDACRHRRSEGSRRLSTSPELAENG